MGRCHYHHILAAGRALNVGRARVLIVEDDLVWARSCEAALRRAGYDVDVTQHIGEMEEWLSSTGYNVVAVSSFIKPYAYFEPVRAASKSCSRGCIFVVTTNVRSEGDMELAYRLGAYRYLTKGSDATKLKP